MWSTPGCGRGSTSAPPTPPPGTWESNSPPGPSTTTSSPSTRTNNGPATGSPRAGRFTGGAWQGRGMADDSVHRTVTVERGTQAVFTATNTRGGQLTFGTGGGTEFTPTELLLAAIGGCTAIDVDVLTSRRAEADRFQVRAEANKARDTGGNRLTDIQVTFQIAFPAD